MKKLILLTVAFTGLCALTTPAMAKKNKAAKAAAPAQNIPGHGVFKRFDTNSDGTLDATEKQSLTSAFNAGDSDLKALDTNSDGKLDENEIAAIPSPHGKEGGKKGKGKGEGKGKGKGHILKAYDTNKDHELDAAEKQAIIKDFDSGKAELKALDTNGDGKLDESEIPSKKGEKGKKANGEGGGKKKKKKNAV